MNGVDWMARRIMAAANAEMQNPGPRFNPKPPGVCLPGSATEAVIAFLNKHPTVFFSRDQIIAGTGRTCKAVDWALLFLRTQHKVFVKNAMPPSNTRHLRYRLAKVEAQVAAEVTA